jgi:hypothetical protein
MNTIWPNQALQRSMIARAFVLVLACRQPLLALSR